MGGIEDVKNTFESTKKREQSPEVSTNQKKEYKPISTNPKQEKEEKNEKVIADSNLEKELEKISSNTEGGKNIDTLVNSINSNPDLKDPENKNIVQKFIDSLKSGDISGAFTSLFGFLQGVMGPGEKMDSTFWFKDNKEIQDFLTRLSGNYDKMSLTELETQKDNLINKIEGVVGVKRKLGLTYALSRLLDEIVVKRDTKKTWIMGERNGIIPNKTPNECAIARMAQQVKPGDVLAVNKSEQKMGDKLLTQLSDDDIDTSHVLIVTGVDPESGKITVAHSTQSKVNSSGKGVETNLDFGEYTKQFHGIAIATLRPPEGTSDNLVKNVLTKDGKGYDEGAAVSTALLGSNITKDNDKYNCVELISQSFPDNVSSKRKNRTHPSQMLENLKPSYVTIAGKSIGGS